jgi:hypothetical protein
MFRSRKRKNQEILQNYKRAKSSEFDFERVVLLFSNTDETDAHQIIPYSTLQDLDFEELFMYMDRTCSKIGQQYLYTNLRTIPKTKKRSLHYEKIIKYLNDNPEIKESCVLEISRLNKHGAYFLHSLFLGKNIAKPKWFWIIPLLFGLSVATLLLSFLFPVFLLVFLPILSVNFIFHYWNKKNILTYSNSIPQLLILNQVAKALLRSGVLLDIDSEIQMSIDSTNKIAKKAIFFKWESQLNSEVGQILEFLLDLIKASFLLEPIFMFKIIGDLELKKTKIGNVFNAVAQVDVALSISSFREGLPYYALPDITQKKKSFYASEIYHPLLLKPVANTIDLSDGKSVLISGSNMSGKTTFIRTIGINTILAQTINTVCAKQFITPRLKVHSAIRIADSLLDDTSFYYKEVKTIKKMLAESESEHQNLFLLDELFKGTNTVERISSGKAVLSYLSREENLVIVSTHDIELTELLSNTYNYFHFVESIENDLLTFDYKLKDGKSMNTNAIRILEINKFPNEVTEEAKILAKQIGKIKRIKSVKNVDND